MARVVAIWVTGILSSGMIGVAIGGQIGGNDGVFFGFITGGLVFACARLWLTESRSPLRPQ